MAVVGSLALSVGAYAYFTNTGHGSGSASVGTSTAWTIDNIVTSGGALSPGSGEQTVAYKVTNSGSSSLRLSKVTVKVANDNGSTWAPASGCSAADFSINGATAGDSYEDVENAQNFGPGGAVDNTVTITMVDTGKDQNACQGALPPLYLSAS
jgi:hypothetical protein